VEPILAVVAVVAAMVAVVALAADGWLWRDRLGLKRRLAEAEAHRLRTQLNPHFLYSQSSLTVIASPEAKSQRTNARRPSFDSVLARWCTSLHKRFARYDPMDAYRPARSRLSLCAQDAIDNAHYIAYRKQILHCILLGTQQISSIVDLSPGRYAIS